MIIDDGVLRKVYESDIVGNSFVIPEGVTSIGADAFYGYGSLTQITIPESVTSIGQYAFAGCMSLTQITIPKKVTSIGKGAFIECNRLTQITIPEGITSIELETFYYCRGLTQITIPKSVTSIGDRAFEGCGNLTQIMIPESVTSIGESAFDHCKRLVQITIPESVTSIGQNAFFGCSSLTQITIPESVTSIGDRTFERCDNLTQIMIPESITSIGQNAFFGCSSLTQITIPEGVTSIGDYAFARCSGLTQITIPESVTSIGENVFSGCSGLKEITIPESVTIIGPKAFAGCSSLTQIMIPESVTSIGDYAFARCSGLTQITIPESVTSIERLAFEGCNNLTQIMIPESVTSIGENVFSGCRGLKEITIPKTLVNKDAVLFDLYKDIPDCVMKYMFGEDIGRFNGIKSQAHFSVSNDFDEEFMDQLYHKIIFSIGIDELERMVKIPNISEDEIKKYVLDKEESFGVLYDTKYKIQGDLGTTLKILKSLKLNEKYNSKTGEQKNNAELCILKEINKLLEEGRINNLQVLIETAVKNAGYDVSEIQNDITELHRRLNKSQIQVNIDKSKQLLLDVLQNNDDKFGEPLFEFQIEPIEKMLEDELRIIFIENGRVDVEDLKSRLVNMLTSEDRAVYIRQQAENIANRVMSLMENDSEFFNLINHNSVDALRNIKNSIGGRWIATIKNGFKKACNGQKLESIPDFFDEEQIEILKQSLGTEFEREEVAVLKERADRENAYKLLEKMQENMPEEEKMIITYKQLHDMFRTSSFTIF